MSDKKDPVFTHEPTPTNLLKDLEDPVLRAPLVAALSKDILERAYPIDSIGEARLLADHLAEQPKGGARAAIVRALINRCEAVERQNHRLIHGDEIESDRLCEHALAMQGELDILKAKLALGAEYAAIVRAEEAEKRAEAAEAERDACSDLVASLNDGCLSAEKRAEAAEAALAALRYESGWVCDTLLSGDTGRVEDAIRYAADCRQAIADTVPAAEAYRARVRREALREAADRLEAGIDPESLTAHALASPKWLRAMADEENKQ